MANIFSGVGGTALNILGAARSFTKGIGLSQRAHELTSSYLNESVAGLNKILSLNVSVNATNESIQQKILALRASIPLSDLSKEILAAQNPDNGNAAPATNGTTVDEEV